MKVVIDDQLIDTDLIVKISKPFGPFTYLHGQMWLFTITLIGGTIVEISRSVNGAKYSNGRYTPNCAGFDNAPEEEQDRFYFEIKNAENNVQTMYNSLVKRWAGKQNRFEDISAGE